MLARTSLVLALALVLSACTTRGQDRRYAMLREELARSQQPPTREPDALWANSPVLSRESLIASVLARNPALAAAHAAWQAELARYPQAAALEDPRLSYSLRPRSFGSSAVGAANDFIFAQPVPFPGKLALRGERALADAAAARSEHAAARVKLASLTSSLFDEYWLVERALEANAQTSLFLAEARQVALARYASGRGSQQDVLAAEVEAGMLEHRERELIAGRRIVRERINSLLHHAAGHELPSPPRELDLPSLPALNEPALVARALERHPELRSGSARVAAGEANLALARREFWPDFTLRVGYETTWQEDPLKPVAGIELNLPFQLERRRAAVEEASARLTRERSRVRQLEDRVRFEVASAVERLREAEQLLEISKTRRIPPARARVASARAAFSTGRSTFLELVDAERTLLAAQQEDAEVRASLSTRRAALARALGEVTVDEEEKP